MSSRAIRSFDAVSPEEYLALAVELALSSNAISRRSAVDRAYYAAFLAARDQLNEKGHMSLDRGPTVHRLVVNTLSEINPGLSRRLVQLRLARNLLTYQTGPANLRRGQSISELLESARTIVVSVRALPRYSP